MPSGSGRDPRASSDGRSSSDTEPRWGPSTTYRAKPSRKGGEQGPGSVAANVRTRTPERPAARPAGRSGEPAAPRPRPTAGQAQPRRPAPAARRGDGPGGPPDAPPTAPPGRRRVRRRVKVLAVVLVLLVVVVGYPLVLANKAMDSLGRVDALSGSTAEATPGRTYLVVGSDSRDGTDLEAVDGSRTDTIMLLHVPRSGPPVLLSIPRDSFVTIPGNGENKINAAFSIGGPQLLTATVEQATGVQIDDYVETGLAGFGQVVDAVGGITICPTVALNDPMAGLDVQPGCQPADGVTALAYARARYSDPRGDLGRVERQREVLAAIASKGLTPSTILNPFDAFPLAETGGAALTVDDSTGPVALARFLLGMRATAAGEGLSLTVPIADTTRRTEHGVVVDWDAAQAQVVFDALRDSNTEAIRPIAEAQAAAAGG